MIRQLFAQSIFPAKPLPFQKAVVFGFDTEFRSVDQKLICWQLAYQDKAELFLPPLSWERLREESEKLSGLRLKNGSTFFYSTFFAMAEAQHLPRIRTRFDQWFAGSYDVTHRVDRYRKLKLIDLAQWFSKQKLADAAQLFGLKKDVYDVSKATEKLLKDPKFIEYAKNDARLHLELFRRLRAHVWRMFQVDILRYRTAASASLRHFRQSYVTTKINNTCQGLRTLGLAAKHGGAVQNYFRGEATGSFYCYDAFSQYPQSVSSLGILPLSHHWKKARDIDSALQNVGGLLHVLYEFPKGTRYPCLITRTAKGNFFPLSGDSFCSLSEARLALKMGAEIHLIKGYVYESGTDVLARYMRRLMKKRKASRNTEESYLYKKFMNSLLGKFGQCYQKSSYGEIEIAAKAREMSITEFCSIAGYAERIVKPSLHLGAGYVPEWYALITGHARASVLEAAWKNNALAVVVDSILTEGPIKETTYGGISYALKETGTRYVAYREMFYSLIQDNVSIKSAHMGSPNNLEVRAALARFDPDLTSLSYDHERVLKLSESIRRGARFGSTVLEEHHKPLFAPRGILPESGSGWLEPFLIAPK